MTEHKPRVIPPDDPVLYIEWAEAQLTGLGVKLFLGTRSRGQDAIKVSVSVGMSLKMARDLHAMLGEMLKAEKERSRTGEGSVQ